MLQFRQVTNPREMDALYRLRYEVYCKEKQFLSADDYQESRETDEFDRYSAHFIAIDPEIGAEPLGCLRLILHNPHGFPCENHFALQHRAPDPRRAVEVSRLIVSPDARAIWRYMLIGLTKEFCLYALEHGMTHAYAVLERPLLSQFRRLGLPLETIGEGTWYYNTYNMPTYIDMQAYAHAIYSSTQGSRWFYDYMRAPRGDAAVAMMLERAQQMGVDTTHAPRKAS